MPTYDYMCDSCGYAFEVQHRMTDNPEIVCPECGKSVHQVFSAGFGLNFIGKGFYQTDTQKKTASENVKNADTPAASTDKTSLSCSGSCGCQGGCSCSS